MWQINNPVYWWALLGLAIPIVIHLYNRRRTKVKILGTLRWLSEVQAAQWNFRRLHQLPLLLIRLLLITIVALLLVEIHRTDNLRNSEKLHALILIHPAAGDTIQYRQLAAGWQNDTVKVHWLATGFPAATEQVTQANLLIWSLVAEADIRFRADSIHIIAPNQQAYFTGTPSHISAGLSWELTDIPGDSVRLLWAREVNNEPELLWFRTEAESSAYQLERGFQNSFPEQHQITYSADRKYMEVKKGAAYRVPVTTPDTLAITALSTQGMKDEWQLFQKAVQAVARYYQVPVKFVEEDAKNIDWMLTFSKDIIRYGGRDPDFLLFRYEPGKSAEWLEMIEENDLMIRKELSTRQVLEGGFLEALRPHILAFKYKQALPTQADLRRIDLAGGNWRSEKGRLAELPEPVLQKAGGERMWLGLLALLLVTLERIWPKKIT